MIFRDAFETAAIGNKAIDWDAIYGTNAKEDLKPRQAEAMHELKRMLRATNKVGRALLLSVCGEGRSPLRSLRLRPAGVRATASKGYAKHWMMWQSVGG
jgi:hypothetical protein